MVCRSHRYNKCDYEYFENIQMINARVGVLDREHFPEYTIHSTANMFECLALQIYGDTKYGKHIMEHIVSRVLCSPNYPNLQEFMITVRDKHVLRDVYYSET
jgi:hypothetical protein